MTALLLIHETAAGRRFTRREARQCIKYQSIIKRAEKNWK